MLKIKVKVKVKVTVKVKFKVKGQYGTSILITYMVMH